MEFETIRVTCEGPLGRLMLNRPERLNALGATTLRELAEAARWFDEQREVRVVIVSGAGRAFSAGADLRDLPTAGASPESGNAWLVRREVGQHGLRMADAIEQMRAVTIAQVHGYAVGGGLVLMAACDLRVAADDAVFSIPEIELGIPLAWGGIPRLVREIGPALTKELVITCRRFTPAEAKGAGFVNRVVPADRLAAEVEDLAREVIDKPAVPVVITKEHVNAVARAMGVGLTAFADGDALLGVAADPESRAAAAAYVERLLAHKRTPGKCKAPVTLLRRHDDARRVRDALRGDNVVAWLSRLAGPIVRFQPCAGGVRERLQGRRMLCGDGHIDPGEECDQGAANSDTEPNTCRVLCVLPKGGDNVLDDMPPFRESRDDGNQLNGDGCPSNCQLDIILRPFLILGKGL